MSQNSRTIKKIRSLRKVDSSLWKKVQTYAKGNTNEKIQAAEIIFKNQYKLPQKSIDLALKFTKKSQPKKLRLKIVECIKKYDNIPYGMYVSVIQELSKDPDEKIRKIVVAERVKAGFGLYSLNLTSLSPSIKSLAQATRMFSTIQPQLKGITETNRAFRTSLFPSLKSLAQATRMFSTIQPQLKGIIDANRAFSSRTFPLLQKLQKERVSSLSILASSLHAKQLTGIAAVSEQLNKQVTKNMLIPTTSFYSPKELEIVKKPTRIPSQTKAKSLATRLKECKIGKENWKEFQDICGDIISYCFSNQFLDPFPQDHTSDNLHIRDFVFPFSENIFGFWKYVQSKFGMGLGVIVECKNYSTQLKENEVIITSKYLGNKKYTSFGLVLTRKGLHKSGKKAIEKQWEREGIMLLCLNNQDLLKMLELKGKNDESSKVIQKIMDVFLRGFE